MTVKQKKRIFLRLIAAVLTAVSVVSCSPSEGPSKETETTPTTTQAADTTTEVGVLGDPTFEMTDPEVEVPILSKTTMLADSSKPYNEGVAGCKTLIVPAKYNKGLDYDLVATKDSKTKTYNLFLPCRMDASDVVMTVINNAGEEKGPYLADFTDAEITDNERIIGTTNNYVVKAYQSDFPSLMIQVDEEYGTVADMNGDSKHETFCYGDLTLSVTDEMALENGWNIRYFSADEDADQPCSLDIRGRGNATWGYAKKAYQIDCENSIGFLGMERGNKYALLANYNDATFMRNQLTEELSRQMEIPYVMDSRQVDLYLNGKYLGLYQISEKVEVETNRVEIDKNDDILFEVDNYYKDQGDAGFKGKNIGYRIHSPDDPETYARSKEILLAAEDVLYSGDAKAVKELFDFRSWAQIYLIQEFMMNGDAFKGSFYFYYSAEENKFYACTPWDFDWSLGLVYSGGDRDPQSCYLRDRWWMPQLFRYSGFVQTVLDEYYRMGGREILASSSELVEEWAQELKLSAEMNSIGAPIRDLEYDGTTYDEAVAYLLDIIESRLEWMNSQMRTLAATIAYRVPN